MSIFMQCSLQTSHFKSHEIFSDFLTDKTLKDTVIFLASSSNCCQLCRIFFFSFLIINILNLHIEALDIE